MLWVGVFALLSLLPAYVAGQLMVATAKCLPGYEWTFNTLNQSPCDVSASLAAVCASGGQFDFDPLPPGYTYLGPRAGYATPCRCSTVSYSLLSACGYCQSRSFLEWSEYNVNCTTVSVQTHNAALPFGVTVPAWAYLNVLNGSSFNTTLAQQTNGTESSQLPTSSTSTGTATPTGGGSRTNAGAIGGGVVGGIVLLILALVVTIFLLRRKRASASSSNTYQLAPGSNTTHTSNSFAPSWLPGGYDGFKSSPDPNTWQHHSPFQQNLNPNIMTSSSQHTVPPQDMVPPTTQNFTLPTQNMLPTPQNAMPFSQNITPPIQNALGLTQSTTSQAQKALPATPNVMRSTDNLWHQTKNVSPPARNVVSPPLGQNSAQNVMPIPRQNLPQNVAPLTPQDTWSPPQYTADP